VATALQKFRRRHPEFSELSDFEIADGLRQRFAKEADEPVLIRPFFEAIGGPELQTELEPSGEPPPAPPPQPQVPGEDARPALAPAPAPPSALDGELGRLDRPDGQQSTEISITVTDPELNQGAPTNIPSLVRGQVDVDALLRGEQVSPKQQRIAIERAKARQAEGAELPAFESIPAAELAARARSDAKQPTPPDAASRGVQPPSTEGLTGLELPGAPGTPQAQLTGANLEPAIQGGQALEAIARFARGGDQPDERVARRAFRQKEAIAERTREILGDAQKETDKEAKDRREAFRESALGPDTTLGQVVSQTMNLIPMTLGLFAATHTNDPEILKTVVEAFGPFDQDPRVAAERRVRSIASGGVAAAGGIIGFLGTKSNIDALQSGALTAQGIAEGLMPRDPAFIEELGAGFGSSAVFWVPGVGIARGAQAIAKTSHVAALWAGAGASGVMEAMAEAGNAFQSLVDQGIKPEEAERRADEVFLQNAAVVSLFNRFGLFGEQGTQFARITLTAAAEGVQEFFQAIIGNLAETDPLLQGAGKGALIGTIVGGAAATATPRGVLPGERAPPPAAPPPPTPDEQAAIDADQPTAPPPTAPPPAAPGDAKRRTAFTPRNEPIETDFAVVDAADLITSNDDAGNINPAFPKELQPRDRSRKTSGVQIAKIAGNLNPELLAESQTVTEGAPIVGDDLVVESGNARVIALRQALADERGADYRRFLADNAERFGLSPQELEGIVDPVLVRIRRTEVADRAEFTRQANQPAVAAFAPAEQARSDAARLTEDDLSLFNPDQAGNPLAASNEQFIRLFIQRIGAEEAAGFTDEQGRPTKQLADRINSAIFARVYGDDRLIALQAEAADPQIKNILAALQAAAPAFAKAKSIDENLAGLNIPEKITDAVEMIREQQRRGGTIEQLLEQSELFGERDPEAIGFARFIAANIRSSERMGRAFSTIAEFLQAEVARQQTEDIFGDEPASLADLLAAANRAIETANAQEDRAAGGTIPDLFGANPPRITPTGTPQPTPPPGAPPGQPPGEPGAPTPGAAPAPTAPTGPAPQARGTRTQEGEQVIALNALELRVLDKAFDELELHETVIDSVSIEVETETEDQADALAVAGEVIAAPDEFTRAELREGLTDIADAIRAGTLAPDFAATDVAAAKAMEDLAESITEGTAEEPVEEQPELTDDELDDIIEALAGIQEGRIDQVKREIARNAKATELAAIITEGSPGLNVNRRETEGAVSVFAQGKDVVIRFGPEQSTRLTPGKIGKRLAAIFGAAPAPEAPAPEAEAPDGEAPGVSAPAGATMDLSSIKKSRIKPASKARPGLVWVRFGDGIFARRVLAEPDPDTNVHRSTGFVIEHAGHPTAVTPFTLLTASGERVVSESGRGWATLPPVERKALALFEQAKGREEEEAVPAIPDAQDPDFRAQAILEQLVFDQFNTRKSELAALIKAAASSDTDVELGELVQQLTGDGDTAGFQFTGSPGALGQSFRRAFAHRIETARPGLGAGVLGETREELEADLAASTRIFETLGHVRATNLSRDESSVFVTQREALTRRIKDINRKLKKLAAGAPEQPKKAPTGPREKNDVIGDFREAQSKIGAFLRDSKLPQAEREEKAAAVTVELRALQVELAQIALDEAGRVTPGVAADRKRAAKVSTALRKTADGLQKQIDAKLDPATAGQNLTPRRARIIDSMMADGRRLQSIQTDLNNMADATDLGSLPIILANVKSKAIVEDLMRPTLPSGKFSEKEAKRAANAGLRNQEKWEEARAALKSLAVAGPTTDPTVEARRRFDKLKRDLVGQKGVGVDFFPTPPELAADLVDRADAQIGDSVLEPSAGSGNIIEQMADIYETFDIPVTALEQSSGLVEVLRAQAEALADTHPVTVEQGDFLKYTTKHDIIVMNPPFSKNQDIAHVRHAWSLLKPGGRLVAVMSEHAFIASGTVETEFRDFLDAENGTHDELEPGQLADRAVTQRSQVKGRIIELNKAKERLDDGVIEERGTSYSIREDETESAKQVEAGQLDLFAPPGKPTPRAPTVIKKAAKPAAPPRVKQVRTGTVHAGFDVVNNVEEAAHVVAPFRKDAQESFVALVLGKGNKVIRVIRHSIGGTAGATADVGIIAGSVAETPGAQRVYFSHNHPSGVPQQSAADRAITERLSVVLVDTGIKVMGAIVVAPGSAVATVLNMAPDGVVEGQANVRIKAAPRRIPIPVTERRIRRVSRGFPGLLAAGSPEVAKGLMVAEKGEGVLLLNNRHQPLKFVTMTVAEMKKLRTGVAGTGANRLQREIVGQNASAALVKVNVSNEGSLVALRNVGTFLEQHSIRMLDGFLMEADGTATSLQERNMPLARVSGTFDMRDVPPGTDPELDVEEDSLNAIRKRIQDAGGTVLIQTDVDGDLSLDIVELPKGKRGMGVGTAFMEALTAHADRFGRDIQLTPHPLDIERKRGDRADDVARLVNFYSRFGFQLSLDEATMFRTTATVPAPSPEGGPSGTEFAGGPGATFRGFIGDRDLPEPGPGAPKKPVSGFGVLKTPIAPDKPLRRDNILRRFQKALGLKIYQGRVKGSKSRLGFYRKHLEELRIRHNNDLEVVAHEVGHFLDDLDPRFSFAYKSNQFKDEVLGLSYDIDKLNEGFAEFVRLFLTQEEEAAARAPGFYEVFVELIEGSRWEAPMIRAQADMHAWFRQGAINRALSKIGRDTTLSGRVQDLWRALEDTADKWDDLALKNMFDELQGLKVAERTIEGTIGDADLSAYKATRLIRGVRGVVRAVFKHGTIRMEANGDVVFVGKGLRQVFEPVADVMDKTMAYFAGRRAAELASQRRENLLKPTEIDALIAQGADNPKIVQAFKDYQTFLDEMMDFYQQAGIISAESRALIQELNRDYVPFHRLLELATGQKRTVSRSAFKRLFGGTANVNDIFDNIMQSTAALVDMAVQNRAKQKVYTMIMRGRGSAEFAVRIPKDTRAVKIHSDQVANQVRGILEDMGIDLAEVLPEGGMTFNEDFADAAGDFLKFFTFGNAPIGDNIDQVMFRGKRVFFEVADPSFLKAMLSMGWRPTNLFIRIAQGFKRTLTFGVTALPDFMVPNMIRDSVSGWLLRRSNMMPFVGSISGFFDRIVKDDNYWLYLANGGGFASSVRTETATTRRGLEKLYVGAGFKMKNVLDTPARLIDWWLEVGSAFEYGTRLAEFKASREQGKSLQESAFRGRDVSTDFAMRGSSDFIRNFISIVPFLNARMQGLYKLERELFETKGKQRLKGEHAGQLFLRGGLAITLPSLALWWLNHDDDRYNGLPDWVKDLHWVILIPEGIAKQMGIDEVWLIPKPFEMGAIFASIPERSLQFIKDRDGVAFMDALGFIFGEQLNMAAVPQIGSPILDHLMNRNFSGGRVIPDDLANVDPTEQFRPWTSETAILLGQTVGMSPLLYDHYVRGYLGTLGMYLTMGTDSLVQAGLPESPTKEFADYPVVRRFTRALPLRRTSYEDEFYELRQEIRLVTSTFNKIRAEGRNPAEYLTAEGRSVLFGIRLTTESIARDITKLNRAMRLTRLSGVMTPDAKLIEIRELRRQRNQLFKDATDVLSPATVRKLRDRLEAEK
jgi:GNAT superfamily N-acetyltransferase/predicted RNA methylase